MVARSLTLGTSVRREVAMVDALSKVMLDLVKDETQLFKECSDNQDFKKWFEDAVFRATYRKSA